MLNKYIRNAKTSETFLHCDVHFLAADRHNVKHLINFLKESAIFQIMAWAFCFERL